MDTSLAIFSRTNVVTSRMPHIPVTRLEIASVGHPVVGLIARVGHSLVARLVASVGDSVAGLIASVGHSLVARLIAAAMADLP